MYRTWGQKKKKCYYVLCIKDNNFDILSNVDFKPI